MGIAIGIDLGTTNSVACIKKIGISAIRNAEGDELTPSCVTMLPDASLVVGRAARDLQKQYPEQTITSVKRLMGRGFDDPEVQNAVREHHVSYPITTDPSEPGSIHLSLNNKSYTPEMISGLILKKLIQDSEAELHNKVDRAVVTVPAYFSDRQKFATRAACDYAGIQLLRLLPEPTAAALSFGLGELTETDSRTIMVFDLGGGTFDISVLSFAGGSFMEVTKGGDMWLGGDNIDTLLANHVFSKTQEQTGCQPITTLLDALTPAQRAHFLVELREKAEAAKITLSTETSATIEMFGLLRDEHNQLLDIDVTITRDEFNQLLKPIVEKIIHITQQILHEIRFEPELIDTVLMVGGSSLVPAIQDALKNLFGADKVSIHPRPMLAVAEGAAFMANKMTGETIEDQTAFSMMHSSAHDYYLQLAGGKKHLLIARNTPLPAHAEETLHFTHKEQMLARLRVFNEAEGILDQVGELWFHKETTDETNNQRPPTIRMMFSVDEDNIINIKAWSEKDTQQVIEAQIGRGGLVAKLYHDLENVLSRIAAQAKKEDVREDVQRLSQHVATSILSVADPLTGEVRNEQKQHAQQQIATLLALHEKGVAPLLAYEFCLKGRNAAEAALTDAEKNRVDALLTQMREALETLTDADKILQLDGAIDEFFDDVPIAFVLARAADGLRSFERDNETGNAREMRDYMKKLIENRYNEADYEQFSVKINMLLYMNFSYDNVSTHRFDRDVVL